MYLKKYDLTGRVAVVTGGAGGMGLPSAHALAEAGASIVITDRDAAAGAVALQALQTVGRTAEFVVLDVTRPDDVNAAAAAIQRRHGRVDILVTAAGIGFNTPAEDTTDAEWQQVLDVNLGGMFWCCRAFGRFMITQQRGAIVNFGSNSGVIADKPQPQAHYNASKGAVHQLTRALATEWADHGVRVNAVAPGYIETAMTKPGMANPEWYPIWREMTPMGRVGQPDEIASAVLFLASDAASYLTGSILLADGGYTSW